jgi:hypothetical protein
MRRHTPSGHVYAVGNPPFRVLWVLVVTLMFSLVGTFPPAAALQVTEDFSPASGPAHVIAQGVVELPVGDAVWRTVRTRAPMPEDALFEERPLGFVLATAGPLLLVDQATGEQVRLGTGEAELVRAGTVQRRLSLGAQPASYLSIELVPVDAPPPPADATVLQPGQAFPAPEGLHDLDLLSATLIGDEVFVIPDSGAKNVVLVTSGAVNVGRPDGSPVVLLAGEAASFSGELAVAGAPGGAEGEGVSFVVAMIGPEVPPPPGISEAPPPGETPEATGTPVSGANQGTITVEVFTCPPGMTAETVSAAACAPTLEDFDITVSGEMLETPLTLGDATAAGSAFTWSELPFGSYVIAEAVIPTGSTTYTLSARETTGDPNTGFRVTIDAANPELSVRIYNFAPG